MAAGLAAELREALGIEPRLVPGDDGIFDVKADGELVFSKADAGRFPVLGELSSALAERAGG